MSLNRCIPFCCNICHFAADYALKPPYFNTCADSKGGGEIFERGGGEVPPLPPPPPPLYESLQFYLPTRPILAKGEMPYTANFAGYRRFKNFRCYFIIFHVLLFFILDQLIVIYSIIHHDVSAETTSAFLR